MYCDEQHTVHIPENNNKYSFCIKYFDSLTFLILEATHVHQKEHQAVLVRWRPTCALRNEGTIIWLCVANNAVKHTVRIGLIVVQLASSRNAARSVPNCAWLELSAAAHWSSLRLIKLHSSSLSEPVASALSLPHWYTDIRQPCQVAGVETVDGWGGEGRNLHDPHLNVRLGKDGLYDYQAPKKKKIRKEKTNHKLMPHTVHWL